MKKFYLRKLKYWTLAEKFQPIASTLQVPNMLMAQFKGEYTKENRNYEHKIPLKGSNEPFITINENAADLIVFIYKGLTYATVNGDKELCRLGEFITCALSGIYTVEYPFGCKPVVPEKTKTLQWKRDEFAKANKGIIDKLRVKNRVDITMLKEIQRGFKENRTSDYVVILNQRYLEDKILLGKFWTKALLINLRVRMFFKQL